MEKKRVGTSKTFPICKRCGMDVEEAEQTYREHREACINWDMLLPNDEDRSFQEHYFMQKDW